VKKFECSHRRLGVGRRGGWFSSIESRDVTHCDTGSALELMAPNVHS